MRISWIAVALLCLPPLPAQENQSPVTREGRDWVQTVEGSAPAAPRLRVETTGNVALQGDNGNQLHYVAKKRVRAGSEAEARAILQRAQMHVARQGTAVSLKMDEMNCGRCNFSTDLRITAPRGTGEVVLETRGGSMNVSDMDGLVNAQTAGGSIQMDRIGKAVRASTSGGSIRLGAVGGAVRGETAGGSITLGSSRGETVLTTSGGGIDAGEVDGNLRAQTAGGSIRVQKVTHNVTAETAGGSIHLGQIGGTVKAETAGGSIVVESAPGGVRAENASGSIRLIDVSGALHAVTAAGNILAQLVRTQPLAASFLETSAGNIIVLIPDGLALTIHANVEVANSLNRIQSDFPGLRIRLDDGDGPRSLIAEGAINGGGPVLSIRNTTGNIQIKRR